MNDDLTVKDLPLREQVKAHLPATAALLAMLALVLLAAFAYTANRADEAQRKANRDAAQLFRLSNARFQYATNRSVCGFRHLADLGISANRALEKRSKSALADKTASAGTKRRNAKALSEARRQIALAEEFKTNLVTVPYDYDCRSLPATPPPSTIPPS